MTEAEHLAKYGSEVIVIHRREELRASKRVADRVLAGPKVRVEWNSTLVDILGDQFVTGVRLKDTVTGEERTLDCKGVFMAIGHTPNTQLLQGQVDLDVKGYIVTGECRTQTSVDGVFAAGDVVDSRYQQAVTAAGMGCMAALDAQAFLESVE